MKELFLLIFITLILNKYSNGLGLCTEEFCSSYLDKNTCLPVPDSCNIQNVTHNGIFLPSPVPCNCCNYCLENLEKGKVCAKGDPSSPTPTIICGSGLSCNLKDKNATCQTMSTPCTEAQAKFDEKRKNGSLGHLETKPSCDRNGLYEPYFCVPGELCYCMSEDGDRIFGEIPYRADVSYFLRCKCSRKFHEAQHVNNRQLRTDEHLRCQANGDYDTLQCIKDQCLCVDEEDGHPTYPTMELINITSISETSLPCFNNKTHMEGEYYRDCESFYMEQINKIKKYAKNDIEQFGFTLPNCQLDGRYGPVQQTPKTKYCSDPFGKVLEDYEILLSDSLSIEMNCKCARARYIMMSDEKPECYRNGNYKEIQCRRGFCRCVDENGVQTEKEVEFKEKESLSCFKKYKIYRNICFN